MKNKIILVVILVLVAIIASLVYFNKRELPKNVSKVSVGSNQPPKFEAFKAAKSFNGVPASPDFKTMTEALKYKTAITEGAKKGPNFAGAYTVVSWGCGSSCQAHAILDAESGKILIFGNDYITTRDLKFNKESNLIIFDPYNPDINPASSEYDFPARYFVFENGALKEIYKEACLVRSREIQCGELSYGFVRGISSKNVSVDPVEMLSGMEARNKASKDFNCLIDRVEECVPSLNNDFYIRNLDKTTINLPIDSNAIFSVEANQGSPVLKNISFSEFINEYYQLNVLRAAPFKLVMKDGNVIKVEQQYLP